MSEHIATVRWSRGNAVFTPDTYSRDHELEYGSGARVWASAAPEYKGSPNAVNPEEMLVGAVSSCHMLTFLAVAAKQGYVVESYADEAIGWLERGPDKKLSVTRIELRPAIEFGGDKRPDAQALGALHAKAHEHCFVGNSIKTEVSVTPR